MSGPEPIPPPVLKRVARHGFKSTVVLSAALILIAGIAVAEWAGWPFLRLPLAQQLSNVAAVPVVIAAPFRIRLLGSPRLTASQLTVAAAEGTQAPFLLDASGVMMSLRWGDLWRAARGGGVRVHELQADSVTAHLMRGDDGRASWQVGAKNAAAPVANPVIERLSVRRAAVTVDDRPQRLHLDVQVAELAGSGKGCVIDVAATAPLCVRIIAKGQYRKAEVRAQFDVDDMLSLFAPHRPSATTAHVTGQAFVGRAMLKFAGDLGGLADAATLHGEFTATGPSLGLVMAPVGVNLPQTPPFTVHGWIGLTGPVWQLAADRIDVGTSRLAGRFAFDTKRQPVYLSGQLTGRLLAMQDLGPSVGVQEPVVERGRVLPDKLLDIPSLNAMDADVDVAIDSFGFGTAAVAPLSALRVKVSLHEGLLKLDKLAAQVAGGTVRGSSSLQAKGEQANWQVALQFDGIALSKWLRSLQAPAASAPRGSAPSLSRTDAEAPAAAPVPLASGALRARLSLAGQGQSVAQVLAGADGQLQATLVSGTLSHLVTEAAGLDVAQALGVIIRGDSSLPLRCARVQARITKGVVGPVQGLMDNSDTTFRFDGQLDMRSEVIDLRLVAFPKDFSPLALRSPVLVKGTMSQPRLTVDAGRIVARVLGALALGAVAPVLAWIPLVDAGEGNDADVCAQPTPAKPGDRAKPGNPENSQNPEKREKQKQ